VTDPAHDFRATPVARVVSNVYRDAELLLHDFGWAQGRERAKSGKLSLTEAVRRAVERDATRQEEPTVVRISRMRRHLREIANTSSLLAWNDAPDRDFDEVIALLRAAATQFPRD
jgi:hypothetical protein